jgi:hypothetical protein
MNETVIDRVVALYLSVIHNFTVYSWRWRSDFLVSALVLDDTLSQAGPLIFRL